MAVKLTERTVTMRWRGKQWEALHDEFRHC
jgi:hypothetical protein